MFAESISRRPGIGRALVLGAMNLLPVIMSAQNGDALRCRRPSESTLPSVGVYSLFEDKGRRYCAAPKEDADGTLAPCLRIGRIHVGQIRTLVEQQLGAPWRDLAARATPPHSLFAYRASREATDSSYYVVEYERVGGEEIVLSLQLTGSSSLSTQPPVDFSCLHLGDAKEVVRRQLGQPNDSSSFSSTEAKVSGFYWDYTDPVSIEIVDGKLFSIRIWRPDEVAPRKRTLSLLQRISSPPR